MKISEDKCVGCGNCVPYCSMGVIYLEQDEVQGQEVAKVIEDECVECSTCYRSVEGHGLNPVLVRLIRKVLSYFNLTYEPPMDVCPTSALEPPDLEWPRTLRRAFSDPLVPHESTGIPGRGTEEIKTNDVTGRLKEGEAGFVVELGRPGLGAFFRDIEKVSMALAKADITFERDNPVTYLMEDPSTGKIKDDILDEKVLSAIIEFKTSLDKISEILRVIEDVEDDIDTVVSVGVASRCDPDGDIPHQAVCKEAGYVVSLNGKTNLGLGRPQSEDT